MSDQSMDFRQRFDDLLRRLSALEQSEGGTRQSAKELADVAAGLRKWFEEADKRGLL